MRKLTTCFIVYVVVALCRAGTAFGQPESYNHPELKWQSIETEHFWVHFHQGAERTAKLTAKIAEEIYEPITSLYQYEPGKKLHFIIRDHDDYSNGGAFFYDNKVEIWATAMDFEFRGVHNWLRNVITHEFTHMVQLQSARKITQRIPAFYFQAIGYENDRRDDVLHGGPNVIASYPIAMTVMPHWFAEGVAQFQVPGLGYDTWDSHRDMILRTAALDNKMLSFNEMEVFGKKSLGNEKVYNHGYAFVSYLVKNYGLETIRHMTRNMKGLFAFTFNGAMKKATGKGAKELYNEWKNATQSRYAYQVKDILPNRVGGDLIESKGQGNFYPAWSPDGSRLAYVSNRGNDYLSQTSLVVFDKGTGKKKVVAGGARFAISWSPDGKKIAYASKVARSRGGSHYYDLYVYDFTSGKRKRLTKALRAHSPAWSPDASRLVFVVSKDGTENLGLYEFSTKETTVLTHYQYGEQLERPTWSPNSKIILYSKFDDSGYDIYLMNLSDRKEIPVVKGANDARDAVFSQNGKKIYFSWDRTGIFNVYSKDLYSGKTEQLTNVLGGAFMPSVNAEGELAFARFTSDGYKIALLKHPTPIDETKSRYLTQSNAVKLVSANQSIPANLIEPINVKNFDDSKVPDFEVKPYRSHYSAISFLPRVMVDYGTVKLGSYFYSYDVLDKYGFLAGFDVNRHGDYDLFALIDYRKFGPTLFLEAYNQVQNTSIPVDSVEQIRRGLNQKSSDKFRYNLMEVTTGAKFHIGDSGLLQTAFTFSRYGARAKFREITGQTTLSYNYFIGRDFWAKYTYRNRKPYLNSEIDPRGRSFSIRYDREFNKFLNGFEVNDAFLDEVFDHYNYNKVTVEWQENWGLPIAGHSLHLDVQGGFIDSKVDSFFNFFAGGILGNRGYPLFSIEGRKMLLGRFTYRLPIFTHMDSRVKHVYLDKMFLGLYFDYGNAFNESNVDFGRFKKSIGAQLRLDTFSFYSYPTKIFFDVAYGLDEFRFADQVYGQEVRFYFGVSFGYLD